MGLDAVVYKHRSKLPIDPELAGLQLDERTGEWYSETDRLPEPIRGAGVTALHKRLGNISLIELLHSEVETLLPSSSLMLSGVLYNGTHCGDLIPSDKMVDLKQEIALLRERGSMNSPELAQFLNDMEELAMAAEENRNPITFE